MDGDQKLNMISPCWYQQGQGAPSTATPCAAGPSVLHTSWCQGAVESCCTVLQAIWGLLRLHWPTLRGTGEAGSVAAVCQERRPFLPTFCRRGCCSWNRHLGGWSLLLTGNELILTAGLSCDYFGKSSLSRENIDKSMVWVSLFLPFIFPLAGSRYSISDVTTAGNRYLFSQKIMMCLWCPRPRSHGAYIGIYCRSYVPISSTTTQKMADRWTRRLP